MSLQLLNKRTYKHRKTHYVRESFNWIMFRIKKNTCTLFCFFWLCYNEIIFIWFISKIVHTETFVKQNIKKHLMKTLKSVEMFSLR